MTLPFSREQFFDVFGHYNEAVWPTQAVLLAAAVVCVLFVLGDRGRMVGWALATFWVWMAIGYQFVFFTPVNTAAWVFGTAFVAGAALFAKYTSSGALRFESPRGVHGAVGLALVLYALVGYPVVGLFAGQTYPRFPTFGLPCPTTIFTLGVLLFARQPFPIAVFVVPLGWSVVGSVAAFQLGVVEDFGLLVAGLAAVAVLVSRQKRFAPRS